MPSLMTNKQAAAYLGMPESTFRLKARTVWHLAQVALYPGRKGLRYRRADVEAILARIEADRSREIARAKQAVARATRRKDLRLVG